MKESDTDTSKRSKKSEVKNALATKSISQILRGEESNESSKASAKSKRSSRTGKEKPSAKKAKSKHSEESLGSKIIGALSRTFGGSPTAKDKSKATSPSSIRGRRWWYHKDADDRILSVQTASNEDENENGDIKRSKIPKPRLVTGEPVERPMGLDPYLARRKKNQTTAIQSVARQKPKEVPKVEHDSNEGSKSEEEVQEEEEVSEKSEEQKISDIKMPIIVYRRDPLQGEGNLHALRGTEIPPEKIRTKDQYTVKEGKIEGTELSIVTRGNRVQAIYKSDPDEFYHVQKVHVLATKVKDQKDTEPQDFSRRERRKELDLLTEDQDWETLGTFLGDVAKSKAKKKTKEERKKKAEVSPPESSSSIPSPSVEERKRDRSKISVPKSIKSSSTKVAQPLSEALKPVYSLTELPLPQKAEPAISYRTLSKPRTIKPTYSQMKMPQESKLVEPSPIQIALSPSHTIKPTYSQLDIPQKAALVEQSPSPSEVSLSPDRSITPEFSQIELGPSQLAEVIEPTPNEIQKPQTDELEEFVPSETTTTESESESETSISDETEGPTSTLASTPAQPPSTVAEPSSTPPRPPSTPPRPPSTPPRPPSTATIKKTKHRPRPPRKAPEGIPPGMYGICCQRRCMRPCAPCPPPFAFSYSFSSGIPCSYHRNQCASSCLKNDCCAPNQCSSSCLKNDCSAPSCMPCLPCPPAAPCPPCFPQTPCYQNTPCCWQGPDMQLTTETQSNASKVASVAGKSSAAKSTKYTAAKTETSQKRKGLFGFFK